MIKERSSPEAVLNYARTVLVDPEAVKATERMILRLRARGAACLINERLLPEPGQSINLRQFQQAVPIFGGCLLSYAFDDQLEKVAKVDVYKALASDHHLLATRGKIDNYRKPYQLRGPRDEARFLLYDLMVPGKIKHSRQGLFLEYSPTGRDWQLGFRLREGEAEKRDVGKLALVHLGLVVEKPVREKLAREIDRSLQSQPVAWSIFERNHGDELIGVFKRRGFSEQRR
jgi:hypothetical protein